MKETRIAQRYAKALFDFALEQGIMEEVNRDMKAVSEIIRSNRDFRLMLNSPVIRIDKKLAVIREIFEKHFHRASLTYLQIITQKGREKYIPDIAQKFNDYYKEFKGIKTVWLKTAKKVDPKVKEKILQLLREETNAQIELIEEVDEKLIGGFVLKFDDKQYDASLARQIQKLQRDFELNEYLKGF